MLHSGLRLLQYHGSISLLGLQVSLAHRSTMPVQLTTNVFLELVLNPASTVVQLLVDSEYTFDTSAPLDDAHVNYLTFSVLCACLFVLAE